MNQETTELSTSEWWSKKRLRYNIGLAIAGWVAFFIYAGISYSLDFPPKMEITLSIIAFDSFLYLIIMGIANFCYFLGPLAETLFEPTDVKYYRHLAYNLGFWFSIALPLSFPGLTILSLGVDMVYV